MRFSSYFQSLNPRGNHQSRDKYEVLSAQEAMLEAKQKAEQADQKKAEPSIIEKERCKFEKAAARYFQLHLNYVKKHGQDGDLQNAYNARPKLGIGGILPDAPDLAEVALHDTVDSPLNVPRPPRLPGALDDDNYEEGFFKDKNGKIRPPTVNELTKIYAQRTFNAALSATMESIIKSGEKVDSETLGAFRRIVNHKMDYLRGITPDTSATSEVMMSELIVLLKDKANKLLKAKIQTCFAPGAPPARLVMDAPGGANPVERKANTDKRKTLLAYLKLNSDPSNLCPTLVDLQEKLIAECTGLTEWERIKPNLGLNPTQEQELYNLIISYQRAKADVDNRQDWVMRMNAQRAGAKGDPVRKQAKIHRYLTQWNKKMKLLSQDDRQSLRSVVAQRAISEAFAAAPRGRVDSAAVGQEVYNKITSAFELKDGAVTPEIKTFADDMKNMVIESITSGNGNIERHANILKNLTLTSLASTRSILGREDLSVLADSLHTGGVLTPEAKKISDAIADSAQNSFLRSANRLTLPEVDDKKMDGLWIRETALRIKEAVTDAVSRVTAGKQLDLKSNDPTLIDQARNAITIAGSVAGAVAVSAQWSDIEPIRTNASLIAREAGIAAATHGKAAAIQAIRARLTVIFGTGPGSSLNIEKWTQVLAEGLNVGFAMQKGESAAVAVRKNAKIQATNKMQAEGKIPAPAAEEIARRLSTLETVTDTAVDGEINRAINFANRIADKLFYGLSNHTTETNTVSELKLGKGYEFVARSLCNDYYSNGLNAAGKTRLEAITESLGHAISNYQKTLPKAQQKPLNDEKIRIVAQQLDEYIKSEEAALRRERIIDPPSSSKIYHLIDKEIKDKKIELEDGGVVLEPAFHTFVAKTMSDAYASGGFNVYGKARLEVVTDLLKKTAGEYKRDPDLRLPDFVLLENKTIENAAKKLCNIIEAAEAALGLEAPSPPWRGGNPDGSGDQPPHKSIPRSELRQKLIDGAVSSFNVLGAMAEASTKAIAEERGIETSMAQKMGLKAKEAHHLGKDKADVVIEALDENPSPDDPVLTSALSALIHNGNSDPIAGAAANHTSVHRTLVTRLSHEPFSDSTGIRAAAQLVIEAVNSRRIIAPIHLDFALAVEKEYRLHNSITRSQFDTLFVTQILRGAAPLSLNHQSARDAIWQEINIVQQIKHGIEVGKEAARLPGIKNPGMAHAVASIATGMEMGKAVTLEIAQQISSSYGSKKPETIDEKTARELIKESVSQVNVRARSLSRAAEVMGVHVDFIRNLRDHYLKSGSFSEDDVSRLIPAFRGAPPTADEIKILYNQLKKAVDHPHIDPARVDEYVKLSPIQLNTLAKMATAFSDKLDPVAAGSLVAGAGVQASQNEGSATILASLAALAGGKAKPEDVANAVAIAKAGIKAGSVHSDKIGSSAAAGVEAAVRVMRNNNFTHLRQAVAVGGMLGRAAAVVLAAEEAVVPGAPYAPPGGARETATSQAADDIAKSAAYDAMFAEYKGNPVPDLAQDYRLILDTHPLGYAVWMAVRLAALKAAADLLPGVADEKGKKAVAEAVSVAGALATAAIKAGYNPEEAIKIATTVANPAVIDGGRDRVEQELVKQVGLISRISLTPEKLRELGTVARSSFAMAACVTVGGPLSFANLGERVERLTQTIAEAAGATPEEAKKAAQDAKAALNNPADRPDAAVGEEEVQRVAIMGAASLRGEAALAVSTVLARAFHRDIVSKCAGASQVTESERHISGIPDGAPDKVKNMTTGESFTDVLLAAELLKLQQEQEKLKKGEETAPKMESIDTEHCIDIGNNLSKPETWKLQFDLGDHNPEEKSFEEWAQEDPELMECMTKLQSCVDAEGKNHATIDTLIEAIQKYNDNIKPYEFWKTRIDTKLDGGDIRKNAKGGVRVTLRGMSMTDVKGLMKSWAALSLEKKAKTKNITAMRASA
jgi:hypothetical protein